MRRWSGLKVLFATCVMAALAGVAPVAALEGAAHASPIRSGSTCATTLTAAPSGPATVAAATTAYGRVLVVGSGPNAGCSLYVLTSDRPGAPTPSFACSGKCASFVWPALLTDGAPTAGPGVNPSLLGTVTRTDVLTNTTVTQVTYAGRPLYQFFLDKAPGQTHGSDLFDGLTTPPGVWYLLSPGRGRPAPGKALLEQESVKVTSTGSGATVLAASMSPGIGSAPYPVYTFSADSGHKSACLNTCAEFWPPLLTVGRPAAGSGVNQHLLGIIVRPDGSHQVTYDGHPLYLFIKDALHPGTASGVGAGSLFGGTGFNTLPPE